MKKVSVFTMLMCFLAGTTHSPCYAGGGPSKIINSLFSKSDDEDKSKTPPVKQGAAPGVPANFDAIGEKSDRSPPAVSAQQLGELLQQGLVNQGGMEIHIHVTPPAQPTLSNPPVGAFDPEVIDTQPKSVMPVLSAPPALKEASSTYRAIQHEGWSLMLPMSMELVSVENSRGKLALIPKVCALYLYDNLSDATHPEFKKVYSRNPIVDKSEKEKALNLIEAYLNDYGVKYLKIDTARECFNLLKQAMELPDQRPTYLKIGHNKADRKIIFSFQIEGGPVIFAKIPGQDQ